LNLKGYKINVGLSKALGHAFRLYGDIIEKLYMESTGTDDEMLATILQGLTGQRNFKAFTYKKSKLGEKSINAIIELVKRPMPHNLDELRIVNCQIKPQPIKNLLEAFADTHIRRLTLVKCGVDFLTLGYIIELIQNSRSLIELDISWNKLTSDHLQRLFDVLATNR